MIRDVRLIAAILGLVLILPGCYWSRTKEQRTTEGPMAEDIWTMKVLVANGREPNFDERRRWDNAMEQSIGLYLRHNPEAANSIDISTFRFIRQVSVGQTMEQVLILLGPPLSRVTEVTEMEKLARQDWPAVKENSSTEAWTYPSGWRIYYKEKTVLDITQYAIQY